jgi:hypothetical protein
MRLPTNDGIACDKCSLQCRNDFTYYSLEFRQATVHQNHRPALDSVLCTRPILEADFCPLCFGKISNTVIEINSSKIILPVRRAIPGIICELSGKAVQGTYKYMYVTAAQIEVRNASGNKPQIRSTERLLEFVICEDIYQQQFAELVQKTQPKVNQWSTKS